MILRKVGLYVLVGLIIYISAYVFKRDYSTLNLLRCAGMLLAVCGGFYRIAFITAADNGKFTADKAQVLAGLLLVSTWLLLRR